MLHPLLLARVSKVSTTAVLLLAAACGDAVSPERGAPGMDDVSQVAAGPDTARVVGLGTLGTGPQTPGTRRHDFDFDVGSSLAGRVFIRDWSVIRPDGTAGKLVVSPTDASTSITAFRPASTICDDPSHGVEVEGVGRVNTGGDTNPAGDELLSFTLRVCDDGPAGSGLDLLNILVPGHGYVAGPDRLTSGDIAKTGGTAPPPPPPGSGDLTITTGTTGSGIPAGYTLSVSGPGGSATQSIGANETVTFSAITPGDYSVTLSDVAANCTVSGGTSRTATVPDGGTATVVYSVSCTGGTETGDLTITTATTGSGIPAGYTLSVSGPGGSATQPIGANESVTFSAITPGDYSVTLSDMAANCTVSGGTSRTATVPAGGTATVVYSVSCTSGPETGALRITTTTTGSGMPAGYTLSLSGPGGSATQAIGANETVTLSAITPGAYSVTLGGVPANCTVNGGTTRSVTVPAGGTGVASYSVACTTPNSAPVVNAGPDQTALTGLLFSFSWSFADANHNGPWSYTIDWGDGSRSTGTVSSEGTVSKGHTYLTLLPRTFTIALTVRDAAGASGSDTKKVTVLLL